MPIKTYAYFDLLGVKKAFENGTAAELLDEFWNCADTWANSQYFEPMKVEGNTFMTSPTIYTTTFSDSALIHTKEEHSISDFYLIANSFKHFIERRVGSLYGIVSKNEEKAAPRMPALGGRLMGSDMIPLYTNIAGSGDAWANIHYADGVISKTKEWHGKYTLYCVGEQSKPNNLQAKDFREANTMNKIVKIFALS